MMTLNKMPYIVAAKHRSFITDEDLNNPDNLYVFRSFNTFEEALKDYKDSFFDDSDYGIFQKIDGMWESIDPSKK